MMFLLLTVIVAIAGFNIVASLAMLVEERRADIAILMTMGASTSALVSMFLFQGFVLAIVGIASGLAIGVAGALTITEIVATVEAWLDLSLLSGTYFEQVPSKLRILDLLWIGTIAGSLTIIASVVPALRVREIRPAQALH